MGGGRGKCSNQRFPFLLRRSGSNAQTGAITTCTSEAGHAKGKAGAKLGRQVADQQLLVAPPGDIKGVGDNAIYAGLKEVEKGKPDSRSVAVSLIERPIIGQRVVVEKETGADVEGDEDVDGVVLMGGQNEEDAEEVQHPADGVHQVELGGRVWWGGGKISKRISKDQDRTEIA